MIKLLDTLYIKWLNKHINNLNLILKNEELNWEIGSKIAWAKEYLEWIKKLINNK